MAETALPTFFVFEISGLQRMTYWIVCEAAHLARNLALYFNHF
jgi:hypothetical protein